MVIYLFLKNFMYWSLKFYFRKIFFTKWENLPEKGPVVFAVNHPTAFLDPVLIASHIPRSTYFMLRGDVFTSPIIRWFLDQIKTIPVFRFRDGFSSLKNNEATFQLCYDLLNQEEQILVLSEGQMKYEKRLRPIQKGTARLVIGAYEKHQIEDLVIVPIGVNYTESNTPRTDIMAEVGEAIPFKNYLPAYEENPRRAVKLITDEITRQLKQRVVHINEDEDREFAEQLFILQRNNRHDPVFPILDKKTTRPLREEVRIANKVNTLEAEDKATWKTIAGEYYQRLAKREINDQAVAQTYHGDIQGTFGLVLGFIPFLLGTLFNWLPNHYAKSTADRLVKKIEFHSSIRFGISAFGYLLLWVIMIIIMLLIGNPYLIFLAILMPAFSFFALHYREHYYRWLYARRFRNLGKTEREELEQLRKQVSDFARS